MPDNPKPWAEEPTDEDTESALAWVEGESHRCETHTPYPWCPAGVIARKLRVLQAKFEAEKGKSVDILGSCDLQISSLKHRLETSEKARAEMREALREIVHGAQNQGAHTGMSWVQVEEIARKVLQSPTNAYDDDPRAARLGQHLFFDTRLSANGAVSCATCHDPRRDFSNGAPLGVGIGVTRRHVQTLWNVAYNRWFFWDGRADSAWSQAIAPLEHPDEHGADRAETVVDR